MATTLSSTIHAQLGWTWRDRAGSFLIADSNQLLFKRDLPDGSAANQADAIWRAVDQSLVAGQSMLLCLGALEEPVFGDTITIPMTRIKAILIVNKNTVDDGYLVVGAAGIDEWAAPFGMIGDTLKVMPASPLLLANVRDGWEVEFGSEILKIEAAGGDVLFDVAILGTTQGGASGSSDGGSSGQSSSSA
jgi:hypothetical protein